MRQWEIATSYFKCVGRKIWGLILKDFQKALEPGYAEAKQDNVLRVK